MRLTIKHFQNLPEGTELICTDIEFFNASYDKLCLGAIVTFVGISQFAGENFVDVKTLHGAILRGFYPYRFRFNTELSRVLYE